MSVKKVFGIISYFPDNDSAYHIETRKERSRRFRELLFRLEELWPDIDIMIIAQNWQDFQMPDIKNRITTYHYGKLGILGARKELRKRFLNSDYDYLIMLDDDAMVSSDNPQTYLDEIDEHIDGIGAIRKNKSPLNFLAISKFIYSQIDMPDVDPEKSEGFEDDIFVASCFAKFPDRAFMFSEGIVSETSFRYTGVGSCPSTWSKEHTYNWSYMRSHTKDVVASLQPPIVEDRVQPVADVDRTIDVVIPYVNGSDRHWVRDFIKTTGITMPSATRFRSWGTLKYLFRGIAKYMPFVRQIVLIVARQSQVPLWVDTNKVRVVYHKDFIPEKYLPTFNSCTIESFLWNIPDLSDRIIYFNDDMFPIGPMSEDTFFTGNKPNLKFTEPAAYNTNQMFQSQCRSGLDMITTALNLPPFEKGKITRPYHISTSITKESLEKVGELCKDLIPKTLSTLRQYKNVNQYIYSYYQYFAGEYEPKIVNYKYFEIYEKTIKDISNEILKGNYQMLCLNDSDKIKDYNRVRYLLTEAFSKKYPAKCEYEL